MRKFDEAIENVRKTIEEAEIRPLANEITGVDKVEEPIDKADPVKDLSLKPGDPSPFKTIDDILNAYLNAGLPEKEAQARVAELVNPARTVPTGTESNIPGKDGAVTSYTTPPPKGPAPTQGAKAAAPNTNVANTLDSANMGSGATPQAGQNLDSNTLKTINAILAKMGGGK